MSNFESMKKDELRAACKAAGISYSKMNNDGMRAALNYKEAHAEASKPAPEAAEPVVKKEAFDPRTCEVCPECGSDELYCGHSEGGVVKDEDSVGGCHHCDWEYDLRRKGIKIEKDREERNGIKRPSIGGVCRAVWDSLDQAVAAGVTPTAKSVKAFAKSAGLNENNVSIEFYQWRKFNGIRGRQS